jgi:predicted ThiF/HesA family dinucleotide-utilizing enzyme
MPPQPISRSADLRALVEEGYKLEIRGSCLLVHHVPYVNAARTVKFGTLLMTLTLAGDVTAAPDDHTAHFIGEEPCNAQGHKLSKMVNGGAGNLCGVDFDHSFSAKPKPDDRYRDYHHKVTAYVARLARPAQQIDHKATALTFEPIREDPGDSPFVYTDTATPRAGLEKYSERVSRSRIAIIGVGGTGSEILDQAAKTCVGEIHLFDGDRFLQHNAFRGPGAIPIGELRGAPNKARFWKRIYSRFRRGIHAHPYRITEDNVDELKDFDFVFISVDDGPSRDLITRALEAFGIPFVDTGLGVNDVDDRLSAAVRLSTGTPSHAVDRARLPVAPAGPQNDYRHNIQIVELNALNATFAIIKWKKIVGVFADLEHEHFFTYATVLNAIVNADEE